MKRIKEKILAILKERALAIMVVLGIIIYTTLLLIIGYVWASNKYEDDIFNLREDLQTSYNTISDLRLEHQECEYFIVPTEDGFVIDGRLYEEVEGFEAYE